MSDPHNIELIVDEMKSLKTLLSSDVVLSSSKPKPGRFVKWEVYADRAEATLCAKEQDTPRVQTASCLLPHP